MRLYSNLVFGLTELLFICLSMKYVNLMLTFENSNPTNSSLFHTRFLNGSEANVLWMCARQFSVVMRLYLIDV